MMVGGSECVDRGLSLRVKRNGEEGEGSEVGDDGDWGSRGCIGSPSTVQI